MVAHNNVFVGESGTPDTGGSVVDPSAFYSCTLDDPQDVKAIVMQGVGVGKLPF